MVCQLVTAKEVSRVLSLSLPQVYALASEGTLPSVRIGRNVRFPVSEIERIAKDGVPAAT